jgi:uncharacterized protein (DUF433 family)
MRHKVCAPSLMWAVLRRKSHDLRMNPRPAIVEVMKPVILSVPDIMGGTPCFAGTRVPFQTLLDFLEAGDPLDEFLENFPSVTREMAVAALQQAGDLVLAHARVA